MRLSIIAALLLLLLPTVVDAEDISEADLREHIEILANDDFGGRKPGTEGENKTVSYIATEWKKAGLAPAAGSRSWYGPVALVDRTPLKQTVIFTRANGTSSAQKSEKVIRIQEGELLLRGAMQFGALANASIVHAGYASASVEELEKSVSGKLAMLFLQSPDKSKELAGYQERKANLVAAGASGVITIIRSKSRFYRSARRFRGASTSLDGQGLHAAVEGVISGKAAERLLRKARVDSKQLAEQVERDGFLPIEVGVYADISVETRVRAYQSHNVVGKIAGKKPESGAVLFLGHWDHLGECRREPATDRICNGAVDNASGISLLIETAKRLVKQQPDRDIYFLATTAEESGLLGAKAFAADAGFPLERLVAVFNADTIALSETGKIIAVVGRGETDLDEDIEKVAAAQNREIDTSDKANAFLKRQDGYVFLEKDIPAFMITSAFSDQERLDAYLSGRYHDVSDELDEELLLGGAAADANFHVALGRYFANIDSFPEKTSSIGAANSATNNTGE